MAGRIGPAEIYGLYDPRDGKLRYIGKAQCSTTRLKGHIRDAKRRSTPVYLWIRELISEGCFPQMEILESADDWVEAERRLIALSRARGDALFNVAPGGNQPFCPSHVAALNGRKVSGALHSDPYRRRIWELKRNLGQALRQGYVSERTKAAMRYAAQKRPELFGEWANIE